MSNVDRLVSKINRQFKSDGIAIRDITYPQGGQRIQDCWRWEGFIFEIERPWIKSFVGSYYTIGECLKRGDLDFGGEDFFAPNAESKQ